MERGRLNPRREALIPPDAPRAPAGDGFRPLRARPLDATHWRIAVPPGAAGWMVLGNSFSDDWKATVDGRDAELTPTNHTAMGVAVPKGAQTVDVELDRTRIHVAAALSVLAWLGIAALIAVGAARRRRQAR
jgi:hypothetical protein